MENEGPKRITIEQLAGMMANGFAEMRDQFATLENHIGDLDTHVGNLDARVVGVEKGLKGLSYKVDQLDQKLDQHRQETKDGFDAMRRVVGGTSRTLADHEERLRALEGE
jgi:septal ring factor EnvC (AmiA/AmiB activator)